MILLSEIIPTIKYIFSGDEAEVSKIEKKNKFKTIEEAKDALILAVLLACEDGTITIEELTAIRNVSENLNLNDSELNRLKSSALRTLIDHITEDGIVTQEEMNLLNELEKTLQFRAGYDNELKYHLEKVYQMYYHV
jgi:tellurite resistance protein